MLGVEIEGVPLPDRGVLMFMDSIELILLVILF
jgi:hypothetical protein